MKYVGLMGRMCLIFVVLFYSALSLAENSAEQNDLSTITFTEALSGIKNARLSQLGDAIDTLAGLSDHPRTTVVLESLLNGKLVIWKQTSQVVIAAKSSMGYSLSDAETGENLADVERSAVKKIRLSTRFRSKLRSLLAVLKLDSEDWQVRLKAVKSIAKKLDESSLLLLMKRYEKETDEQVLTALKNVFAIHDLNNPDSQIRIAAIETLQETNNRAAYNQLKQLSAKDETGRFQEADEAVAKAARKAVVKIESRMSLYEALETLFFGLSLGAVLVLAAIGLAITFGVMGVINMAHGELMMLGAYTTYVMQQMMPNSIGMALLISIPAAFVVSGLVGVAIERGVIRFLYGRPLETLLATFGVSLFLQQTVRSIFSPLNRSVSTPEWMSGSWQYNEFFSLTLNRFYILLFSLIVFAILLQILRRTRLGLEVRAVSQNRHMAKAMGIPTARVDAMTFGLGSGIAGVAGVALSQITNVGPNLGQSYIVDSFMVVVFGGVGNLWGTLVAGFSLGIANKVLEPYAGAVLAKILVLLFIILFIQKKPRGLFPQKGRAAES